MKKLGRFMIVSSAAICALGTMTNCNRTGFKVGLLCLHGQTSTYDNNFIDAFKETCSMFDLKEGKDYEIRTDVKEDYNDIYTAAKEWAEDGYSLIFADSFGHQYGLIDVAKEYPKTEFCHATGTTALLNYEEGLKIHNYHNAFAHIYKGRYLSGVAAGQKMLEDIDAGKYKLEDANIGYVGAWPYAEVISGYTSFYLGACSMFDQRYNPDGTRDFSEYRPKMYVKYTYSWYDYGAEKEAAFSLIGDKKCKLISQHADSMGAPQACASQGIPNVCYNISTKDKTPNTYLFGSKINWRPYFKTIIQIAQKIYKGDQIDAIPTDNVGDLIGTQESQDDSSVQTLEFGNIASKDVKEAVRKARLEIGGETPKKHIFDCRKFTVTKHFYKEDDSRNRNPFADISVDGKWDQNHVKKVHIDGYKANVIDDPDYLSDTLVTRQHEDSTTKEKYFYVAESGYDSFLRPTKIDSNSFRSAPFFELIIDGIETLN